MNKAFSSLLILILLLLYGCGASPTDTVNQDISEPEVIFQGNSQKEEIQTLAIDNCDGKSDLSRTEERSQSVDVTLSAEIAAKIGASAEVISAEVQAAVGAATTQSGSRSMSIQLTAPPKTHMQFQLVWTGNEQIGVVQNLRGANLPIAFRGFAPTDVRIKSQNDIGCPYSESIQEIIETQPAGDTSGTPKMQVGPYWGWRNDLGAETLMLNILSEGSCVSSIEVIVDGKSLTATTITDQNDSHYRQENVSFEGGIGTSCNYLIGTGVIKPVESFTIPLATYGVNLPPQQPYEWCYQASNNTWYPCQ